MCVCAQARYFLIKFSTDSHKACVYACSLVCEKTLDGGLINIDLKTAERRYFEFGYFANFSIVIRTGERK